MGRGVKCTVANTVCSQEDVKPEIRGSVLGGGEGPPCRLEFRQLWQPQSFCVSSLTQCFFYVASCLLNSVPDNFCGEVVVRQHGCLTSSRVPGGVGGVCLGRTVFWERREAN